MKSIKALRFYFRLVAIVAVLVGIVLAFAHSWNDAIYAIVLAILVWSWGRRLDRTTKSGSEAGQGRQTSQKE